jgi:hypothetical protein
MYKAISEEATLFAEPRPASPSLGGRYECGTNQLAYRCAFAHICQESCEHTIEET